jgi:F-type H+-transporting ATPase subunit a
MPTLLTEFFGVSGKIQHIVFEIFAFFLVLFLGALAVKNRESMISKIFSLVVDFWRKMSLSLMHEEDAKRHVPFVSSLFIFILIMNIMGLIPGLMPPTMNINTNIGIAIFVFLYYNYFGFKKHGLGYIKHFLGPFLPVAFLYFPIELISHVFRIASLSIRLAGNMTGDHSVLEIFTHLTYLVVPIAFLILGTIVSIVQAFVFSILSLIYVALAVGEEH